MFFCECCEIFKNTYFEEHLWTAASVLCVKDDSEVSRRLLHLQRSSEKEILGWSVSKRSSVLREKLKLKCIRNTLYFGVLAGDFTDIANQEEVSLNLRWLNHGKIQVYEDFVGLFVVRNINSEIIVAANTDSLFRCQPEVFQCCSQTYDGASNMMEKK